MIHLLKERMKVLAQELDAVTWAVKELEAREKERASEHACKERPRHFTITTHFLKEKCYPYLMQSEVEFLAYLSGVRCKETTVIDQLVTFRMDVQNPIYVRGDQMSTADALIMLDERGFLLEGTIHCHPGHGECATEPSNIDYRHHRRLEVGGYKPLGVVMTRDGYVRFYTDRMPFEVTLLGTDAVKLSPVSYRLAMVQCDQAERETEPIVVDEKRERSTKNEGDEHEDNESTAPECEAPDNGKSETDAGRTGREGVSDGSTGESPRLHPGIIA